MREPEQPLQRIERRTGQAVTSPIRLSRRGVSVPFRVLPSSGVAGLLGYPFPVRSWHSRKRLTLPVFPPLLMPEEATPRAILSWDSVLLHGISRTLRPRSLDLRPPLLGFLAPSAHEEEGVHVPTSCPAGLPGFPGYRQQVPPCQLRCRSQVFSTSQRLLSSLRRPAMFQTGGAHGVRPSGVLPLTKTRRARHRRRALLTFLPLVALPPS
jgi:hypothetical protein